MPTEPVDSVFGFDKTLLETPRSVSVLSDDLMAAYGIETALDVAKIVPSTFTTSIFGINGNVNIRGVASDTYFRGREAPGEHAAVSIADHRDEPPGCGARAAVAVVRPRQGRRVHQFRAEVRACEDRKVSREPHWQGRGHRSVASTRKRAPLKWAVRWTCSASAAATTSTSTLEDSDTYYDNVSVQAADPAVIVRL